MAMLVEDELLGAGAEVVGPAGCVGDALRLVEEAARDRGLSAAVLDIDLAGAAVEPVADRLAALGWPRSACRSCSPRATARPASLADTRSRRLCTSRSIGAR